MKRLGWWAALVAALVAVVVAGCGIAASEQSTDIGSIDVAAETAGGDDGQEQDADGQTADRAGAAPTIPEVARQAAGIADQNTEDNTPVRVRVDAVDLDAPLDATGVRDDGLMQIPDDGERAGWYRYGPAPGAGAGSVVVAGHVDTSEGLGAMAAMREVPMGTTVEVEMSDGSVSSYEVVGRETIAKDNLPTEEIFERDGPERLTLITCGGPWRSSQESYRDNVVVVAMPIDTR